MEAAAVRPLDPEERAEILARNPGATAEDVEAFEALLVERFELEAAGAPLVEGLAEKEVPARLQEVEAALADLEARVLPNFDDAVAAVAARRVDADDAAAGDDGPPVG
jgi:hypothetical protein